MESRIARIIAGVVMVGMLSISATNAFSGHEKLFSKVKDAAWAIYIRSPGGMNASCSAVAVKSNDKETLMLSAAHCFLGTDNNRTDFLVTRDHRTFFKANVKRTGVELKPGMKTTSDDLADYSGNDWALVKAEVGNMPTMKIGDSSALDIGQEIVIVGVPFGVDFLAVQGIVGSKDVNLSTLVWNHYYGGNIFIAGGNSGSGVIAVKQEAIVGIVDAGPGPQTSMLIFMPIDLLPKDLFEEPSE